MKVLLTETIDSLGIIGSEVSVTKGYARNYLIPQKKSADSDTAEPQATRAGESKIRTSNSQRKEHRRGDG
jgi:large subunit ribosomal protein L9